MSCEKCKETNVILSDSYKTKNGTRIFADLRFDTEFNQLDISSGTLDANKLPDERRWSHSVDIKFCPFCGEKLLEIE